MPYTTEELAFRFKTQYPQLRSVDNKALIQKIVARRPEVRSEILDYEDTGEAAGAARPNAGLPMGGFESGVANAYLKPAAGLAGLIASQWRETPATTRATEFAESPEGDPEAEMGKDLGNASQYYLAPNVLAKLRAIPALANAPWLRAALGAGVEGGKAGLVTRAQGGGTGEQVIQSLLGAGGGAISQLGKVAEAGATKSFARSVGAEPAMVEKMREIAPDMIRNEGVRGTRASMGAQVAEKLPGATAEQVAASSSPARLDLKPTITKLGVDAEKAGPGLHPTLNEDEIAMLRELTDSPMFKNLNPTAKQSVLETFNQQFNLPKGTDLRSVMRESEGAHKVLAGGIFTKSEMLSEQAKNLEDFQAAYGGTAPLDRTVRYRQALGDVGVPGAKEMPSQDPTLRREVARHTAERLNETLHDMGNPATARLANADKRFSQLKTLDGVLRDALSKDVSNTQREHFAKYIMGRVLIGSMLGAGVGGATGQSKRSTLEGVAAGAMLAAFTSTALWNSMSAGAKLRIADAINAGHFDRAAAIFEAGAASARERGGMPQAPRE